LSFEDRNGVLDRPRLGARSKGGNCRAASRHDHR
jgi:hypothetical protein